MAVDQFSLTFETMGRGALDISNSIDLKLRDTSVRNGVAHIFLQHTSASMMLCENADPTVLVDLEMILKNIAPDGDPRYQHDYEGDDDMPAHIRSILTSNDISLPVTNGRLNLGTWQGLFLYEHRYRPHSRKIVVTVIGE